MKISKTRLRKIIKEEVQAHMVREAEDEWEVEPLDKLNGLFREMSSALKAGQSSPDYENPYAENDSPVTPEDLASWVEVLAGAIYDLRTQSKSGY